jgi:L-aminopeptidase/D-esterase-like protein
VRIGVAGVRVGHWTDPVGETGCTVVGLPERTVASCEVRGGAPATRELDALSPEKAVAHIDAVVLTGGSAFGLAAADGAMRYYEEIGRGVQTSAGNVPLIPTLALFDLAVGDRRARPTADHGYSAAVAAIEDEQVLSGRVGAGAGAYVSHWRGPASRRPGGLVYQEQRSGDVVVGALCAVNAFGDITHGAEETDPREAEDLLASFDFAGTESRAHTTIGVVITNAKLDKMGCRIIAQGAHDGLSRAITPPHTRYDGDAFIAAATGEAPANLDQLRLMALKAVSTAIRAADLHAPSS